MTSGPAENALLGAAETTAWAVYVWVLAHVLPSPDLGRVLFALVFSACVGRILTVGWKAWLRKSVKGGGPCTSMAWSAAVAGLAARCLVALPVLVLISWQVGGQMLFPASEVPLTIAILAGLSALLRLAGFALHAGEDSARAAVLAGPLPVLLALAAVLLAARNGPLSFDIVLAVHVVCLLAATALALRRLPTLQWSGELPKARIFADSMTESGMILFRNADIMVIGLVLTPVEAAIYLIVRGIAMLLNLHFRILSRALFGPIAQSWRNGEGARFVSLAARANLGFLLIGGSVALLLLVLMNPALHLFGISAGDGRAPLIWLIIAQSAPVIFGATNLFMALTRLERVRAWVVWAAMPLALTAIFAAGQNGLVALAATYATLQIGFAAICAGLVAVNCGIWPGLTAMFHSRIRLR